ncbi:tripartite tricarboxylate transporter TctB family protein [Kushneria phyllosphaerae]|uniref:DUF1468 domain-containing protein n=1 Tax=Kushneria phyllosphaerae TaxID=2100822 RepID=A0A2R8CI08_9GAMM|nr:tripartite tricarboxylate transporter TctB family protein [Kushneria phyllosphaerae]SPJ32519.1 hypothetical protein KSP9073_00520 [Kushneria phyllosphaerae]
MQPSRLVRHSGPLLAAGLLAILAFVQTYTFKSVPAILARGLQPATFPRLVTGLILILAVIAFIHDLRRPPAPGEALPKVLFSTTLLLVIFSALLASNLFLIALITVTVGTALLWGERRVLVLTALALSPVIAIVLFDIGLEVRFPRSPLLNLYYEWR